jgi:hypothetical protein
MYFLVGKRLCSLKSQSTSTNSLNTQFIQLLQRLENLTKLVVWGKRESTFLVTLKPITPDNETHVTYFL